MNKLLAIAALALVAGSAFADSEEASTIVTSTSTGTLVQYWSATSASSTWGTESLSASVPSSGSTSVTSAALCKKDDKMYLFVARSTGVFRKEYSFTESTGKLTDSSTAMDTITPTATSPSFQAVFCVDNNLYVVDQANSAVYASTDFTVATSSFSYGRTLDSSTLSALQRPRSIFVSNTAGVLINMYFGDLGDSSSGGSGQGVYAQGVVPNSGGYTKNGDLGTWVNDSPADKIAIDTSGVVWFTDDIDSTNNIKISTGAGAVGAQSSSNLFAGANSQADMRFSNNRLYFQSGSNIRFLESPVRTSAVAVSSATAIGTTSGTITGMAVYYAGSAVRPLPTLTVLATALAAALLSRRFW